MREIIFRGKTLDKGEWVYGNLITDDNDVYILTQENLSRGIDIGGWIDGVQSCEVIPETVGQYTGLKDKNGKRIFEGDCFKTYCTGLPVYRHIVRYYPEHFAFMARCIERNTVHYLSDYSPSVIEVIGNVHDGGAYD